MVDDLLRIPDKHQPTVGILLVAGKDDTVVRYALASTTPPIAVSRYELGEDAQKALPDEEAITRAFADELAREAEIARIIRERRDMQEEPLDDVTARFGVDPESL